MSECGLVSRPTMFVEKEVTAPQGCLSTLTGDAKTQCANYTTWTGYMSSACGFLLTGAELTEKFLGPKNKKLADEIYNGLGAIYTMLKGANDQFLAAIVDINKGQPYAPIIDPSEPPPFPPIPKKGDEIAAAIAAFWSGLKPWLEKMIAKLPSTSPWVKVLEGVITSSETWIVQLEALFKEISE